MLRLRRILPIVYSVVSPKDWNLQPYDPSNTRAEGVISKHVGMSVSSIKSRCEHAVYDWLDTHWNEDVGAFHGFYDPVNEFYEKPQLVNLIAPWILMAASDRYGDDNLLDRASRAADWLYNSDFVVSHPMSIASGGVREPGTNEIWSKYTAEYVQLNLAVYERNGKQRFLDRALQSGRFLMQIAQHNFAPRFRVGDYGPDAWDSTGWQAFGRIIEAFLVLYEATGEEEYRDNAMSCGEYALTLQKSNGGFFLMGEYHNTDLAADPIRALVYLYELGKDNRFLHAACRFAEWHVDRQNDDGSWAMTSDANGNIVVPTVGPGDMPNIAISLFRLHQTTLDQRFLDMAVRAIRYTLHVQITPESTYPHRNDPSVLWGFWSWMPYYDYTVSADQATHHIRGMYFLMDYLGSLSHNA